MAQLTAEQQKQLTDAIQEMQAHLKGVKTAGSAGKAELASLPPWLQTIITLAGPILLQFLQQLIANMATPPAHTAFKMEAQPLNIEQREQLADAVAALQAHLKGGQAMAGTMVIPVWVQTIITLAGPEILALLQQFLSNNETSAPVK